MASSSSSKGKGLDKREEYKDMHVKLDYKFIEYLKNKKEWPETEPQKKTGWTVTEEQLHAMAMKTYDFDYVLKNHLLDEEIVWEEDVWGSKQINAIPDAHAKKEEKGKK